MVPVKLIVDTRERAVIPFIEDCVQHDYQIKQINTADYLVCSENRILAAIERKTLMDFAASFADARYENKSKMINLRKETGCQLFFFVEGAAFPSPNRKIGHIPYANILAAMTKMMICDNIFVVQTENEEHTAKRLVDFLNMYSKESPFRFDGGAAAIETLVSQHVEKTIEELVLTPIKQTDNEISVLMWMQLRGISLVMAKMLSKKYSFMDIIQRRVTVQEINELKTATGRKLNKDGVKSLLMLHADSHDQGVRILSGIRSITADVARVILLSTGGMLALSNSTHATMKNIPIPQKTRTVKLGDKRAALIIKMLNHRASQECASQESAPQDSAAKDSAPQESLDAMLQEYFEG